MRCLAFCRPLLFSTLPLLTLSMVGCRVGGPSEEGDAGPDVVADGDVPDAEATGDGFDVCTACHGSQRGQLTAADPGSPAPPLGLHGETKTTTRAVGAHRQHLGLDPDPATPPWHVPVSCDACHAVPQNVEDEGHIGMSPAELVWSALASARHVSPSFDGTRCNVYCHGVALLPGGSDTAPAWTTVDGSQAACGTCHGLPPDPPHPASNSCPTCHRERFEQPTVVHIDGTVEVAAMPCNSCHGSDLNAAPPVDTEGNAETTFVGVGAHQSHLESSTWHREMACTDCHVVPATVDAAGHTDSAPPAELTWGTLATADGATPAFETATATCTGTYCHGATLSAGGSNTTPVWTTVDDTQAACGTCHALPPSAPHPSAGNCYFCHPAVVDNTRAFVDPTLHINGRTDF